MPNAKHKGLIEFGRELVETGDLDPVYVVLHEANLEPELLKKWLLAYWCFYHPGTASWIADGRVEVAYWARMFQAARSKDYPRCPERRHFRGENAIKSVTYLMGTGLMSLLTPLLYKTSASELIAYVQSWVGFGPWISFKVADMLERLGLVEVEFTEKEAMYDSPREGAVLWYDREGLPAADYPDKIAACLNEMRKAYAGLTAPPRHERPLGFQEFETILCKWKSHLNGHYAVGEDVEALERNLSSAVLDFEETGSYTADHLYAAGEGLLW